MTLPAVAYAAPLAVIIFLFTLTLVIWRPRGLGIGFSALGGALLALVTGIVTWQDISAVWEIVWNSTFTLIALMIFTLILEEAGCFRWLALQLARLGMGSSRLLLCQLILVGAALAAVFTTEGTTLIWMVTVIETLLALGLSRQLSLVFAIVVNFIAGAASLPLQVSNLVNLISADYFQISFLRYTLVMLPVNLAVVLTSLGVLWFYFNRYLPTDYPLNNLTQPSNIIRDPFIFQWSLPVLLLLLFGYFLAEPLDIPVSLIAGLGTWVLLLLSGRWFFSGMTPVINFQKVLQTAPWHIVFFTGGMSVIVFGLHKAGLTTLMSRALEQLSHWGITQVAMGTGFLAALLSSVFNHIPTGLLNAIAIQQTQGMVDPTIQEVMVYANVIGCNLGAKITPIGSLSTLLWLHFLAHKGIYFSWGEYIRISILLTLPVLCVALLSLAIWLPWLIA